ncbi:MAG: DedA family protein [Bacteroidales bacterium]|jgi:membrane protein YqaA with SNARE-associated domain|nr:DedA family protein [Bacteroidales bacterium]
MDGLINLGYLGLFIGTFLSGTVIPLSSDVLLIGILALGGNEWLCLLIATIGNWLGGMTSYGLGWLAKWEWLERWFDVKPEKLHKQKETVNKYGAGLALFAWVPAIGSILLIALGFYKVKPKTTTLLLLGVCFVRFLIWTLLHIHFA